MRVHVEVQDGNTCGGMATEGECWNTAGTTNLWTRTHQSEENPKDLAGEGLLKRDWE